MSLLPPPPPPPPRQTGSLPPPPPPPPHAQQERRPRWFVALAIAITGIVVVGAIAAVARVVDGGGPSHPEEWDPRVAPLADYVEAARGVQFDHPVHVDFLTADEYSEATTGDPTGLADDDRVELDRYAAELRAFGLATGDVDLFEAYNQVADAGTLAFYDPAEQRVRVRGTEMTVGLEVTIVHELTHALQDQAFDLGRLQDDDLDSSAYTAYLALVEGDALRIEQSYTTEELTAQEQADYEEEYAEELESSREATSDVPPFITASFGAPYALGQPFVVMLANDDGNEAVDEAFRDPPTTEEHIFDPASFLAGEGDEELELGLDDDVEVLDDGPFGSPTWYLVLAERLDPKVALTATLGWAGDAYASYERDGRACVRAVFAGDDAQDEEQMAVALAEWAEAMPAGAAEVIEVDGHPGIDSCDPGADVEDPNLAGRSLDALALPSLWGYLVADAASVLDAEGSRCYAAQVIDGLSYEQITDPEGTAFQEEGFQEKLLTAFQACS